MIINKFIFDAMNNTRHQCCGIIIRRRIHSTIAIDFKTGKVERPTCNNNKKKKQKNRCFEQISGNK